MDNQQIAGVLETIGDLLDVLGENAFKVRAYRMAARSLESLDVAASTLVREDRLREVQGIGDGLAKKIAEFVTTGRLLFLEELKQKVPCGVLDLMRVRNLGPKKARVLWQELQVTDIEALKRACEEHRVRDLRGFGEKSEIKILEGIAYVASHIGRFTLDQALPVARALLAHLRHGPRIIRSEVCGSIRRWRETIRDVDVLVSTESAEPVIEHFLRFDQVREALGRGPTKCSVLLHNGLQVDLRVVKDDEFAAALLYFTGSKEHSVLLRSRAQRMGLSINEYGVLQGDTRLKLATEEEIYALLGLAYVPPELREAGGEIEAAEQRSLPRLVERSDLRGVFHVHSTWSDGTAPIADMAEKARRMGLSYMGLSDHSKAAAYAGGLNEERLARQWEEIDRLNAQWSDFRILKGLECDILPDGSLDMTPEALSKLDFVIGSVHSRLDMDESEMTFRVCKALHNKYLHILGHPTGRRLLQRDGYKVDLDGVIEEAARTGKVIEVNAHPLRLDLDWTHVRHARELGVRVSINPDAHSVQGLEDVEYGVGTARRGWATAADVINTRPADEALALLRRG